MKKRWKRCMGVLLCAIALCTAIPVQAEEQVKISDKEYLLSLTDAAPLYISNNTPVSGEIGSKVFITYTVAEVTKDETTQSGVIGCMDNTVAYPYSEKQGEVGTMKFEQKSLLLEEGWTYVFRFERTEGGYEYQAARLKDGEEVWIDFPRTAKGGTEVNYPYYGVWFSEGGKATALLNHVRCYDEKGNDLGIHFSRPTGIIQSEINQLLDNHPVVRTSYDFTIENKNTLAISNKYPTDSKVVYMEYELADVKADNTYQQGVMVTRAPRTTYPYTESNGLAKFKNFTDEKTKKDRPLLIEGAKYFICFNKKDDGYDVVVQRTLNGKVENISFPSTIGVYDPSYSYFSIWLGEGAKYNFTATFKNFKCYDAKGNNLGVQVRFKDVQITEKGEIGKYDTSIASYYCEETNSFVNLLENKKASKVVGTDVEDGTYSIYNKVLNLNLKGGKETYDYNAMALTDSDGKKYERMKSYKVTFVTGEENIVVKTEASNGYRVVAPEAPAKKGNTFKGWCLANGEAYDFDTVVRDGMTLYAKWENEDGIEYLAVEPADGILAKLNDYIIPIVITSATVLIASAIGCYLIVKRRKQR